MGAIEVLFKEEPEDDEPEPLRIEHFYFPLGLWLVGVVLSAVFFLTEIIINRKSKKNVPMLTPEVEHNSNADNIEDTTV